MMTRETLNIGMICSLAVSDSVLQHTGFLLCCENICPLISTRPHLICDVGLEEGECRKKTVSVLQYCVLL